MVITLKSKVLSYLVIYDFLLFIFSFFFVDFMCKTEFAYLLDLFFLPIILIIKSLFVFILKQMPLLATLNYVCREKYLTFFFLAIPGI